MRQIEITFIESANTTGSIVFDTAKPGYKQWKFSLPQKKNRRAKRLASK